MDKKEKYILIGVAVVAVIVIIIIAALVIYFVFFRGKNKDVLNSIPKSYLLKSVSEKYLSSEANKTNFLSTDSGHGNAIFSANSQYVLYLDENANIYILKESTEIGLYSEFKRLYKNTSSNLQKPLKLYLGSRKPLDSGIPGSGTIFTSSSLTTATLISSETPNPSLKVISYPNDKPLGVDTNNYALYVTNSGEARIKIYTSGSTFDPTVQTTPSATDYIIEKFVQN